MLIRSLGAPLNPIRTLSAQRRPTRVLRPPTCLPLPPLRASARAPDPAPPRPPTASLHRPHGPACLLPFLIVGWGAGRLGPGPQVVLSKPRKPDAPDAFWDSGPAAPAPAKASKKKK